MPEGSFKYCAREVVGVLASEQNLQAAVDELLRARHRPQPDQRARGEGAIGGAVSALKTIPMCRTGQFVSSRLARRARDRGGGAADPRCWRGQLRRDPLVGRHACTRHDRASLAGAAGESVGTRSPAAIVVDRAACSQPAAR